MNPKYLTIACPETYKLAQKLSWAKFSFESLGKWIKISSKINLNPKQEKKH